MTQVPGPHLSPDDIDRWLDGTLPAAQASHLEACQECLELARAEREVVEQITALPLMSPPPGFADRVMQSVVIPDPFAIRTLAAVRRRVFATRRSLAAAATLALVVLGGMAGSVAWTLGNQDTLAALGSWLVAQGAQAAWVGVRGVASNLMEQPWYDAVRVIAGNPARLAAASALAMIAYLAGVFALRRLLALPTQQVAHAGV